MSRWLLFFCVWALTACAPSTPPLELSTDCRAEATVEQLLARNWLQQPGVWRLRQSALLELGPQKIPLEGFLRLDLDNREAHLLAMNEMGLVLFELQVSETGQQLNRAIPQLQQVKGFAQGIGQSLRQIFFQPRPDASDQLQGQGNSQRLWRSLPGGEIGFVFDCRMDLRQTRQVADNGDWRVGYDQYRVFGSASLPEQIILNDYRHRVKLSLWIREVKQEP